MSKGPIRITLCHSKGGVSKTTLAILLIEFLLFMGKRVSWRDGDEKPRLTRWVNYVKDKAHGAAFVRAQAENRELTADEIVSRVDPTSNPEVEVIDTQGAPGAAASWLKESHLLITPFIPNQQDTDDIAEWFPELPERRRKRFVFVPTQTQRRNEQEYIIAELRDVLRITKIGLLVNAYQDNAAVSAAWDEIEPRLDEPSAEVHLLEEAALLDALAAAVRERPTEGQAEQLTERADLYEDEERPELMAALDALAYGEIWDRFNLKLKTVFSKIPAGMYINFFDKKAMEDPTLELKRKRDRDAFTESQKEAARLCAAIVERAGFDAAEALAEIEGR